MARGLYVYAIAPIDARLPEGLRGFQGTALMAVCHEDLAAIVSPIDLPEIRPTPELVLAHEEVVEGVRRVAPSLPVRFGTVLADAAAVERVLAGQRETLATDLRRIGDKVELGLTVLWDEPPVEAGESGADAAAPADGATRGEGTRYLLERLAEHRRETALERKAQEVARDVESVLVSHAMDRRSKILPTARMPLRASYLVDPNAVDAFRAAFDELRRASPALRFLLTGPWPPYSFVTPPDGRKTGGDGRDASPAQSGEGREHDRAR